LTQKLFLPSVHQDGVREAQIMAELIAAAPWQKRKNVVIHPDLMLAAQAKANDMAEKDYFGHVSPDGFTANENVRVFYALPSHYVLKGNNVESLSIGGSTPEQIVSSLYDSPRHHDHLTGDHSFYAGQTAIGTGVSKAKDGRKLWVFVSAPSNG